MFHFFSSPALRILVNGKDFMVSGASNSPATFFPISYHRSRKPYACAWENLFSLGQFTSFFLYVSIPSLATSPPVPTIDLWPPPKNNLLMTSRQKTLEVCWSEVATRKDGQIELVTESEGVSVCVCVYV